jgi:DNA-binding NarL/FixJ family response regulator
VRENAVAACIAMGKSNKEVAEELNITERTVKAHLSACFNKLDVRDRMQLALIINK